MEAERTVTVDGFKVTVGREVDESPDLSYLGEFWGSRESHKRGHTCGRGNCPPPMPYYDRALSRVVYDGAPVTEEEAETWDEDGARRWDGRQYRYIVPANWDTSIPAEESARYFEQDAGRLLSYGEAWACVGVVAVARRAGVKLGGASVWGIETDSAEGYFAEVEEDMIAEAVAEAKAKLAELRA